MKELVHLAAIMDGNGRWAEKRGLKRIKGHEEGARAAERVAKGCINEGIRYLTLYCFSTENWKRPKEEVEFLMGLLAKQTVLNIPKFNKLNIRVVLLGDRSGIPADALAGLDKAIEATKNNTALTVQLAINYGGRDEIARAVNRAIKDGVKEFKGDTLLSYLDNPSIPDPDMIVRSAGEERLSGFMLYQSNYSEFAFFDELWPDWDETMVKKIVDVYNSRVRKFGDIQNGK